MAPGSPPAWRWLVHFLSPFARVFRFACRGRQIFVKDQGPVPCASSAERCQVRKACEGESLLRRQGGHMRCVRTVVALVAIGMACGTGCTGHRGYEKAFSGKSAMVGNSHRFEASTDQTFQAVKFTLVQQGFLIDQADPSGGLIKAARNLADEKNKKISYNVNTTVDISGAPSGRSAIVTMAASQQTVTHSSSHTWMPLLGPLMIPMPGKKYQTAVTGEGTIIDAQFYGDFFVAVERSLRDAAVSPTTPPASAPARSAERDQAPRTQPPPASVAQPSVAQPPPTVAAATPAAPASDAATPVTPAAAAAPAPDNRE